MFFRKVTSRCNGKEYTYVKLIENYREGKKVKQRVIANLGNIEDLTPEKVRNLISGLTRICGLPAPTPDGEWVTKKVLEYGSLLPLQQIWDELDLDNLLTDIWPLRQARHFDPYLIKLLVFNHALKPASSQDPLRWSEQIYFPPPGEEAAINYSAFYHALIRLPEVKTELEKQLAVKLSNTRQPLRQVQCLLLRSFFEPQPPDVTGLAAEIFAHHSTRRQVDLALFITPEGIPIAHHMFIGNLADGDTVPRRIKQLLAICGSDNCLFTGEQGIITEENLQLMAAHGYYYLAHTEIRFHSETDALEKELFRPLTHYQQLTDTLWYRELRYGRTRYLIFCEPFKAAQKHTALEQKLAFLEKELATIQDWIHARSAPNPQAAFYRASAILKDNNCRRYFICHYDELTNRFTFKRRTEQIEREIAVAGKLVLKTNNPYLTPNEALYAYQNYLHARNYFKLIRTFRLFNAQQGGETASLSLPLVSSLWSDKMVEVLLRSHVAIAFLSYLLLRLLENKLANHGYKISAATALEQLSSIKVIVSACNDKEVKALTEISTDLYHLLESLGIDHIPAYL